MRTNQPKREIVKQAALTTGVTARNTSKFPPKPVLSIITTFLTNTYNTSLNLADIDDRKLFAEAYKGLKEKDTFNGSNIGYNNFVKLIESEFKSTRIIRAPGISTK